MTWLLLLLPLIVWVLWAGIGGLLFWWGTRTPLKGSVGLVRSCTMRVAFIGEPVQVQLWPSARELPISATLPVPHRVVLLLDHSLSMGQGPGSPLDESRKAAISFLRHVVSAHCQVAIVQFDDTCQELHPLCSQPGPLVTAVRGIGEGGATDIALALQQAQITLAQHSDPSQDEESVVLLLSDGGSDQTAARTQAELLKNKGIRLVTLALGRYADADFLKSLASQEGDFFHALDAPELARLYDVIGATLEQSNGTRGRLGETINVEAFTLSGTGDARPDVLDFNRGTVRWFLPFVRIAPQEIAYQITPRCCGWHRIAQQPASISMLDSNGDMHEYASNSSPHLLVLPRLGWPVTFVLLNPLWFLLFGCKREPVVPLKPAQQPAPLPVLPDAARVHALVKPRPGSIIAPTFVIAVGFAGSLVLRALREQLGPSPDGTIGTLDGLWIDTADGSGESVMGEEVCGAPIADQDRVLMPDNLKRMFDDLRSADSRPAHLQWLDAASVQDSLRPADYDLSRGTGGRRVMGRAAFYNHLAGSTPALGTVLGERLRKLPENGRVVIVAGAGGGTGSGMLVDVLAYLKKCIGNCGLAIGAIDTLVLGPHRIEAPDDPARLGNACALAIELGRIAMRGHQTTSLPQTAAESESGGHISRLLDGVLVLERLLEPPTTGPAWPAALAHAAAQVIHTLLLAPPQDGAGQYLAGQRKELREAQRRSGHAMVHGVGATSRWLPIRRATDMLAAKTVFEFLAQDLLPFDLADGRAKAGDAQALSARGSEHVNALLRRTDGLARPLPDCFSALLLLADRANLDTTLVDLLRFNAYPHTVASAALHLNEPLAAEIIHREQTILGEALEEWVLQILHPQPVETALQTPAKLPSLAVLISAVEQLDMLVSEVVEVLQTRVQAAREQQLAALPYVLYLFIAYRQTLGALKRHIGSWQQALAPATGFASKTAWSNALAGIAHSHLSDARDGLAQLRHALEPAVVWFEEVEQRFSDRYVGPVRKALGEHLTWSIGKATQPFELVLCVHGVTSKQLRPSVGGAALFAHFEQLTRELGLAAVAQEAVSDYVDLGAWLKAERADPVALDANQQRQLSDMPARRDFALVPSGTVVKAEMEAIGPLQVIGTNDRHRACVLRFLSPCAIEATAMVTDYKYQFAEHSHRELPLLHRADQDAAYYEDLCQDYGISTPCFSAAVRAYFQTPDRLRGIVLAGVLELLQKRLATTTHELWLGDLRLTDERDERDGDDSALLLAALDRFVADHHAAPQINIDAALQYVEVRLAQYDEAGLEQLIRNVEQGFSPLLEDCPRAVRADILCLARLYLHIEISLRNRSKRSDR